jgi:formylglycine-generating enzyme required for sulfatase activity
MVLVFTAQANNSNEIKKELALASQNNLVVIPVRIEDVIPSGAFAYELATRQWIDMFDDWENSIAHLVELIAASIDHHPSGDQVSAAPKRSAVGALGDAPTPSKAGWQSRRALLMATVLGVVLVGSVGVWVLDIISRPTLPPVLAPVQPPPAGAQSPAQVTAAPAPAPVAPTPLSVAPAQPTAMPAPAPNESTPPAVAPALPAATPAPIVVSALSPEQERALKPKDKFKECSNCPEMIVVPAGSFTMGSPESEQGAVDDEGPRHKVTFANPFAVGEFALTFDEWDACVADGGCDGYRPSDQGWGRGRQPAINVSWDNAKAYVAWLAKKTGKPYRLLSEAEREYVTRAGTTTPFWWGSSISTSQANYNGNYTYGKGMKGEDRARTLPVDSFAPNPWGLYQVHGNVNDWTEDCYHESYQRAPGDGAAWTQGGGHFPGMPELKLDCRYRVLRGGSWNVDPSSLRSAYRDRITPTNIQDGSVGFRVGRTLLPP